MNARVLSYRDLEAFIARGEAAGPPSPFQRPLTAEERKEHWQAIWQAKEPGHGHVEHYQDNAADSPTGDLEAIRDSAPASTLTSHAGPDDLITSQAHHSEPPPGNATRVRRTVHGVIITITAWLISRAQQAAYAPVHVDPGDPLSSTHGDYEGNQLATDDAEDAGKDEDDANDRARQHQVPRHETWIITAHGGIEAAI